METIKQHLGIYTLLVILGVWYLGMAFSIPITTATKYGLASSVLLRLGPILVVATWLVGTFGALKLFSASQNMMPDQRQAYRRLVSGIFFLIAGTVLTFLMRSSSALILQSNQSLSIALIMLSNSLSIIGQLIGFTFIYLGSRSLKGNLRQPKSPIPILNEVLVGITALFGGAVIWSIFTNPVRTISPGPQLPTYFLPDSGIFLLIVLPFVCALILGLLTTLRYIEFYRTVTGSLYKFSALMFSSGMLFQLLGWVLFQAFLSVGSARLLQLGFGLAALTVIPFLLLILLGFILISLAASRLGSAQTILDIYSKKTRLT